jgi:tetratricopeptide (TPR) repeat protein
MALGNLGRASWELGEKDEAEDCYKKALEILDVEDDPIQKAGMLDSLGMIERECRNPKKAEELHRQALTLAKDHRNRRVEARSRDNLGLDFFRQGKIESSLQCFNDAFGLSHEIGDLFEEVSILTHLGAAYREAAEKQDGEDFFSKAEDCLTRARDLSQVIGDRRIEGRIHADFGLLWLRKGELDRALECHKEHLRVAKEMHDPWGENAALYHLGLVHLQGGKIADAKHDLEDARRLATQLGSLLRGPIEDALKSADLKK